MSGFKDTTKTVSGHHHWGGGPVGSGTGGTINRLARGGPVDKIDGLNEKGGVKDFKPYGEDHGLVRRSTPMTEELKEAGGTTPLRSGFKAGGPARHFHVHHHHHAKGGKITTSTKSYRGHEKKAEAFAEGGHVHDSTRVPAGGPDYKRGGKTRPVKKNAGGAMYAPGGAVAPPMLGAPQMGALGRLAARPAGLPSRGGPPMRRPMGLPGPMPLARAGGGTVPMRKVAKQEVAKHVRTAPPRGHGVR
jgi:hypothetical protein